MKQENAQFLFTLALFICLCLLPAHLSQGADEKGSHAVGAVFTTSQPISNGFVFVEGQYVEAPYVVSRKDMAIYINDQLIANYAPLVKEIPKPENELPSLPANITVNSTPYDKNVVDYMVRVRTYLSSHHKRSELADELEKVYKALPCVKDVRRNSDKTSATVIYTDGHTINENLIPLTRKPAITPTNAVEYVSRDCRDYVQRLEKGDVYSFSHKGNRKHTFSVGTAKEVLPGVVKVLRSSQDDKTKAKQLADMLGMAAIPKEQVSAFVTNLSPSKQLDERVDALTSKSNCVSQQSTNVFAK
ncbi:MAG: hypothetical protein KJ964_14205 [Verrucomicrobia bacterium]|nr:hypothetical protein [Verrucomicrobiota bacterium]MBU1736395.1 hypothetical protein [Verrucomicrobiota bacterium]MBU1857870.1 hypothetical protein [Verrucomicrobiota bacterium]